MVYVYACTETGIEFRTIGLYYCPSCQYNVPKEDPNDEEHLESANNCHDVCCKTEYHCEANFQQHISVVLSAIKDLDGYGKQKVKLLGHTLSYIYTSVFNQEWFCKNFHRLQSGSMALKMKNFNNSCKSSLQHLMAVVGILCLTAQDWRKLIQQAWLLDYLHCTIAIGNGAQWASEFVYNT